MNPAQMLRTIKVQPSAAPTVMDYAQSARLSPYACARQKICPICGQKGDIETYTEPYAMFFFCENKQHIFEIDNEKGEVDRIDMG